MKSESDKTVCFDHEKLDVYQLELHFLAWVTQLLKEIKEAAGGFHREVCDQLDRASLSSLLNTAEGNGKRQGRQRAKFFDDARGSAVECAACLDALVAKQLADVGRDADGKAMLVRIVGMLTKLVERFDDESYRVREDEVPYGPENPPRSRSRPSSSKLIRIDEEYEKEGRGGATGTGSENLARSRPLSSKTIKIAKERRARKRVEEGKPNTEGCKSP
jgi:four helix bundle protein